MSASKTTTVANITASGDILLETRPVIAGDKLNVIGAVSSTAGDVYLTSRDMEIGAAVTTNAGDIYLYDLGAGFALGTNTGTGVKLNDTEIALLQAADTNALVIGRGKVYTPPANI
ncbi:MAG: hypothetical protein ACOX6W_04610 [Lentisphaeria bacterium]